MEVLDGSCKGLQKAGVPVDRGEAFVRTLHPNIAGRSFLWRPGDKIAVSERTFAWLQSAAFTSSPMNEACATGRTVTRIPEDLAQEGFTGFVAAPLMFITGMNHVITLATKAPGGFTAEHIAAIEEVVPAISRVGEVFALLRTATNLLSTYVGRNAGSQILGGKVKLGDTDTLQAVIWFSDLRGFTTLTRSAPPPLVIRALNELFGCQIPAIEQRGGEVLKFMGDGLLAIFPLGSSNPSAICDAALDAARDARDALRLLNVQRESAGHSTLDFGLALHLGEVSYGNIGGANRLDFTCIGPAVNVAARLEALASKLSKPIVLSEELAKLVSRPVTELGSFELKGVDTPQKAFAPA